jgi:hypothetical protein
MLRPKIFYDTNICIAATNKQIDPVEWSRVHRYIRKKYAYCISFITAKEIFGKLARCADQYFGKNKAPLQMLYGCGRREFLAYPPAFALEHVLQIPHALLHEEPKDGAWLSNIIRAVLLAPSKQVLRYPGIKYPANPRFRQYFDLDDFDKSEDEPQREHAALLEGIRNGSIDFPNRRKWAAWIFHQYGINTPLTEQCEKLVDALDAAYRVSESLSALAKNSTYDFSKKGNVTDWGDALQLFYLCDPRMHFLTMDGSFEHRTSGSPQAGQVILYQDMRDELLKAA